MHSLIDFIFHDIKQAVTSYFFLRKQRWPRDGTPQLFVICCDLVEISIFPFENNNSQKKYEHLSLTENNKYKIYIFLMLYIEKEIVWIFTTDSIIDEFLDLKEYRVAL